MINCKICKIKEIEDRYLYCYQCNIDRKLTWTLQCIDCGDKYGVKNSSGLCCPCFYSKLDAAREAKEARIEKRKRVIKENNDKKKSTLFPE